MADHTYLVAGLGNPGSRYENTRHNIGFIVLDAFARIQKMTFRYDPRMRGNFAKGSFEPGKVYLLKPDTYMNLSGEAVRAAVEYYKIPLENVLIVTDDIYLPFGQIRLKGKGSSGGHNGLENIERHLQTNHYPRMRIGVGHPADSDMAEYVLQNFSAAESKALQEISKRSVYAIELWLKSGLSSAMNQCNVHPKRSKKASDTKGEIDEKTKEEPL